MSNLRSIKATAMVGALTLLAQATPASAAIDFSATGFGSAYYGQSLNSGLLTTGFKNTKANFTNFSLLGTDLTAKIGDGWSVATEVIATGTQNSYNPYAVFAQWGYVSYNFGNGFTARLGRQRYPLWTASEYINNHHELPYREMPDVVYAIAPFNSFDGASLSESISMWGGKFGWTVFGGTPILDASLPTGLTIDVSNLIGARVGFEGDGWRVRAVASTVTSSLTQTGAGNWQGHQESYTAGYRFDKYNIVSWGEYGYFATPDGAQVNGFITSATPTFATPGKYLARINSGYVLLGYHLDKFLPRYTFAQTSSYTGLTNFTNAKSTSHTIGLNYAANEKVTLKGEWQLNLIPQAGGGAFNVNPTGNTSTVGSSIFFGADFEI